MNKKLMSEKFLKLLSKAGQLSQQEKWDEYISVLTEAISLEVDSNLKSAAYYSRGLAYDIKSEYDRAIEDYSKAIELEPDYAGAYNNRGATYERNGDYDRAIEDFSKAIELEPDYAGAYNNRGATYERNDDYDRALEDCSKAIELKPDYAGAYYNRGVVYGRKSDYDRALEDFIKAIELKSNYAYAYIWRGIIYFRKNDYDNSFVDFGEAIRLNSGLKWEISYAYIRFRLETITDSSLRIKSFQYCSELWEIIDKLKENLLERNIVAHYTSLGVLGKLLSDRQFRFYNATYMNDPEEGETFFAILSKEGGIDIKQIFYENSVNSYSPAYIGSFTKVDDREKEEDKLFLWRTYGKQENEEAGGACLIFGDSCFSEEVPSSFGAMTMQEGASEQKSTKPCLYQVLYQQEEDDERRGIILEMADALEQINTECLKEKNNNAEKESIRGLVRELLDEIRFLFKAEHYREEKEMRVVLIQYIPMDSTPLNSDIKEDTDHFPPRLYLDAPEGFHFKKVLLGPRALGLAQWRQWARVKQRGQGIPIEKSKIPYAGS